MTLLLLGSFFALVLMNVPIAVSLGVSAMAGLHHEDFPLDALATILYASIGKFSLLAIPFFILAGVIMERADISKRLIRFAEVMVGNIRGGMIIIAVAVCCFFAAISGSGPATVAALGGILLPSMLRQGYGAAMPAALLSAAGSIGIVIPPSIAFVIYAVLAEVSVTEIFLAGIVPGLVIGVMYAAAGYYYIRNNKELDVSTVRYTVRDRLVAFKDALWGLMAPLIILGGIYGGFFTPTEAAGVTVVYGLFVGVFVYRTIKFSMLHEILLTSAVSSAVVMFIVACASVFAWLLTISMVAREITEGLLMVTESKILLLLLINLIFLIAGCFLDTISAYYILIPVMLPIMKTLSIDPVHFGVFVTVNLAIGQFTPPVGANLYVACNIARIPLKLLLTRITGFIVAGVIGLLLITFIPQISLWLPHVLRR